MRRILVLLTVVALMVVMLAMSVSPAFAAWNTLTGCRGNDQPRPADIFDSQGRVEGKRTENGLVCVHIFKDGSFRVYDDRDLV
jgi:hypothetical protein